MSVFIIEISLKAVTHQADVKELAATKADCVFASRWLRLGQKAVLEQPAKTPADCQPACVLHV